MAQQIDIASILGEMSSSAKLTPEHREKMHELIRRFHAAGATLETLSGPRYLGRSLSTLKTYARELGLSFPDYVPMSMRPPKPPKQKKPRATK